MSAVKRDNAGKPGRDRSEIATDVRGVPVILTEPDTAPHSNVHLLCVAGTELGESFSLPDGPVLIGRGHGEVKLRAVDVSRTHARITRQYGRHFIEDLHSANGTFVNGIRVTELRELALGDRVQLGSTILMFTRSDELEERLRQLQRIDAMGALVKGLAHDFNNTLQVLLGGIAQLQSMASNDEMQAVLDEMTQASASATGLVRRLNRIGHNKPETQDVVQLATVIRGSVAMAKRVTDAHIRIEVTSAANVAVRGSRGELEQALLNVLINARDAMPRGGTIVVASRVVDLDRASAHARHLPGEGAFAEIAVRDEGVGMDSQTLARAFEPFFTTKEGKGTGLGLAMAFSTMKSHGGTASLESTVGVGTVVRLLLPIIG